MTTADLVNADALVKRVNRAPASRSWLSSLARKQGEKRAGRSPPHRMRPALRRRGQHERSCQLAGTQASRLASAMNHTC